MSMLVKSTSSVIRADATLPAASSGLVSHRSWARGDLEHLHCALSLDVEALYKVLKAMYLGAYIVNWLFKPQLASLKVPLHRTWKIPFILMQMQHRCVLRYDLLQPRMLWVLFLQSNTSDQMLVV